MVSFAYRSVALRIQANVGVVLERFAVGRNMEVDQNGLKERRYISILNPSRDVCSMPTSVKNQLLTQVA